jgi:hypothetical protein
MSLSRHPRHCPNCTSRSSRTHAWKNLELTPPAVAWQTLGHRGIASLPARIRPHVRDALHLLDPRRGSIRGGPSRSGGATDEGAPVEPPSRAGCAAAQGAGRFVAVAAAVPGGFAPQEKPACTTSMTPWPGKIEPMAGVIDEATRRPSSCTWHAVGIRARKMLTVIPPHHLCQSGAAGDRSVRRHSRAS